MHTTNINEVKGGLTPTTCDTHANFG